MSLNAQRKKFKLKAQQFFRFLARVMQDFKRNQGLLLSGALAYYTLLSIVPMSLKPMRPSIRNTPNLI